MTEPELTRRGFIELGSASALALGSGGLADVSLNEDELEDEVSSTAVLLGPANQRPEPGSQYFEQFDHGPYLVYVATDSGVISYIQGQTQWTDMNANPTTQVDELVVEDFESQFNYTFTRPNEPNTLRWNSNSVTADNPEVVLTGTASLQSTSRGNYAPGSQSIPGVAFRVTDTPGVGESGTGGYYTTDDGMLAGVDENGAYAEVRDAGTATTVRLDGEGNNGTLPPNFNDFQDHTRIVRFPHLFYRGGAVGIDVLGYDGNTPRLYRAHTFTPQNVSGSTGTPISQPNLPVAFNTNSLTPELRVSAAHYEKGEREAEGRTNGEFLSVSSIDTTDWYHLISWRKQSNYDSVRVEPLTIKNIAESTNFKLQLLLDSTLSGGTWTQPDDTSDSETAVEVNTGATLTTNGERRWIGIGAGGSGNKSGDSEANFLNFNLPVGQVVTLAAQAFTNSGAIEGAVLWEEYY